MKCLFCNLSVNVFCRWQVMLKQHAILFSSFSQLCLCYIMKWVGMTYNLYIAAVGGFLFLCADVLLEWFWCILLVDLMLCISSLQGVLCSLDCCWELCNKDVIKCGFQELFVGCDWYNWCASDRTLPVHYNKVNKHIHKNKQKTHKYIVTESHNLWF